jgi:fimbrial isopeptide formation D2 family protein/LPXTG-motif cell wall-anchored protein
MLSKGMYGKKVTGSKRKERNTYMKKFKKVIFVLTMLAVWCMAVTGVMATDHTVNVTISYGTDHTYVAYQIFTGASQGESGHLGDIVWGDGVNTTGLLADTDLQSLLNLGTDTSNITAFDVASKISDIQSRTTDARKLARIIYKYKTGNGTTLVSGSNTLPIGYYLIVDTTNLSGTYDANNMAILQLTDSITISQKVGIPTVTKKVREASINLYNDVADYTIGDKIPFRLTATLPEYYSNFKNGYQLIFHDTMSIGLSLDKTSFVVKVGETTVAADGYTLVEDGHSVNGEKVDSFCLKISDVNLLKDTKGNSINAKASDPVTVEFNGYLNENAVIGSAGNTNEIVLEYSNNPNVQEMTGETPKDQVIILTYGLDIKKVDKSNTATVLKGAEFMLMDSEETDAKYAKVDSNGKFVEWTTQDAATPLRTGDDGKTKVYGLDEGTYYLKETVAPYGYQTPTSPFEVIIKADTNAAVDSYAGGNYEVNVTVSVDQGTKVDGTNGVVTATVENSQGSLLPTTGGRGLYILYAVGIFFLAAGVTYQVRKKRKVS